MSSSNDPRDPYREYSSGGQQPRSGPARGPYGPYGPQPAPDSTSGHEQGGAPGYAPPAYGAPGNAPPGYGSPGRPASGANNPTPWNQPQTQGPYGQPPYGQPPYGQPPYGQPPYGQPPYGWTPPAPANTPAQDPYGANPYGRWAPQPPQASAPANPAARQRVASAYGPPRATKRPRVGVVTPLASATPLPGVPRPILWIALGAIVVVLALATIGGSIAYGQYQAPAMAGQQFCADLQGQSYDQGYGLLSAGMRAQMTSAQFSAAAKALDQTQGKVTACAADSTGGYNYALFGKMATAAYIVTRQHVGPTEGSLRLKSEAGGWRVDSIDAGMLGASLGAVIAANSYCAALTGQRYADAYTLLGAKLQAATKKDDFAQMGAWHDQIDGQVIVCALTSVGAGGSSTPSDTAASLGVTATRTLRGVIQGALKLAPEGGAWKITDVAATLQGTDIAPLQASLRFCGDLASGNYADIYTMVTQTYLNGESQAQLAADLSGKAFGVKWATCTLLDVSGYKLSGTKAYVNIEYTAVQVSSGYSWKPQGTLTFVKQGDTWMLNSREGLH